MSGALRGTASKLRPLLLADLTKQLLDSNRFHSQVGDVVLRLILMLLTLGLVPLVAKPKIAVVNIDTIYAKYHRKLTIEKEVQDKVDALKNSSRVLAVEETDTKLQELAETVRDKKLPAEARELAAEEFNSLAIEHQALIREMKDFLREEKRKTTRELVETVEQIIVEIRAEISKISQEQQFDFVFEEGGKTSTQVSPIIYLREKIDITEAVLEVLNADAPDAPAPEANEE